MTDRFLAFRHSAFARYWCGRFAMSFAVQIISVAVAWQIYDITRDAWHLGLIGLVQFLPSLLLVLVTGSASDRYGRRMIMGLSILAEAACALVLLALTILDGFRPVTVLTVLTVFGVARAFLGPAQASLVVNLVPKDVFPNAVSWNSSAWQLAGITGPAVGGLMYGVSPLIAYGTATLLLVIAAFLVFSIPKPPPPEGQEKRSLIMMLAGFRYIWTEKIILGAISLDLFAVLLGGAVALLPVYARDILHLGPWGLGILRAAPGIGAIITALWLSGHPIKDHAGVFMFIFVGIFGALTALFGISTIPWLSILLLALIGAADMISVYIRETLLQLWTPDEVRGRVNAVNMVFLGASNELGEFRAGGMAKLIGAVPAVVFGGLGAVAVAMLWAFLFPQLRNARYLTKRNGNEPQ